MKRRKFIQRTGAFGLGAMAAPFLLQACRKQELDINFNGKVIVIGAGAAGMMAAYRLKQLGADVSVLEASGGFGGRVSMFEDLTDFPIDIGAEWIHTQPDVFSELINDENVQGEIDLIPYQLETMYSWNEGTLSAQNWAHPFYGEYKFKSTTWYQFFEQFIIPEISDRISYDVPVIDINHEDDQIIVTTDDGTEYPADRVIITVPLNVLKADLIQFQPALPDTWLEALGLTTMPPGIKVFMKFSEKFYPDILTVGSITAGGNAEKIYYDAAFKKDSQDHVLALFYVGESASELTDLPSTQLIMQHVLDELDEIFAGQASANFLDGVVQNWQTSPWIRGSYSFGGSNYWDIQATLKTPINNKLFFAGEALYQQDWATVHGAGFSGIETAERVLQSGEV